MIACSFLDFMQYAGTYYANTNFTAKFPRGNPTPQTPQAASIISVRFTACPAETPTPYAPSRGRGEKTWSKLLVGESFSKGTTKMCLYPFHWERNAYPILLSTFSLYLTGNMHLPKRCTVKVIVSNSGIGKCRSGASAVDKAP